MMAINAPWLIAAGIPPIFETYRQHMATGKDPTDEMVPALDAEIASIARRIKEHNLSTGRDNGAGIERGPCKFSKAELQRLTRRRFKSVEGE